MRLMVLAALLAASFTVSAGNDHANPCGNNGNNCGGNNGGSGGTGYGGAGGDSSAVGVGVGIGLGVGYGGSATGGAGGSGGAGGRGGDGGVGVGLGGAGGDGGSVVGSGNSANLNHNTASGGSAFQGQSQSSVNGQQQSARSDQSQSATATNAGNSQTVGGQQSANTTNVSYRNERSAPPVYLGAIAPTVSCAGGVNAGASSQGGSGAFGFTWISADCKQTVAGQNLLAAGYREMACEVFRQTDGFKRAAKRNPALNEMACK